MFNILNSDANIAIKVDIGVHFVLKHIKMRVLEYVLLPEKAIYWRFFYYFCKSEREYYTLLYVIRSDNY